MGIVTEVQIKITTVNPFEAKAKMQHLKDIAKLDTDVLGKLVQLGKNPKAINQIKNNFDMIESFLG